MRLHEGAPSFQDDRQFKDLSRQLKTHGELLRRTRGEVMQFGSQTVSTVDYGMSLLAAHQELTAALAVQDVERFRRFLREKFQPFEVYGEKAWGDVLVTGYYDPIVSGRLKPDARHFRPVFGMPTDMVMVDVSAFAAASPRWAPLMVTGQEQKSDSPLARGRLVKSGLQQRVLPYWSREEIDTLGMMYGRAPILAYVDPIDAFFMQIQGSATIDLDNGKRLRVGYASQNGYPYFALGKALLSEIPREQMSMQSIAAKLREKSPLEAQRLMNQNGSYVFFTELEGEPRTTLGTEVVAGRTIATDRGLFPKGALAWLEVPLSSGEKPVGRLVMDQDTGGAIRGPGRVDLFFGQGPEAEQAAGRMKERGRLIYLVPRSEWLSELRASAALNPEG